MQIVTRLIVIAILLSGIIPVVGQNTPPKFQGFLGTYHPFKGTVYGGGNWKEGELMQNAFAFGQNAVLDIAAHNGYTFEEMVRNSCGEWDVNKVFAILLPPSEHGVVNQPADTNLWSPVAKEPGMIQAAHRFSELSKQCPQIEGIIIDDFFNDFPKDISLEQLKDIKGALLGKRVDADGNVDQKSAAETPNLKMYIVVYEHHLERKVDPEAMKLIDGLSFWIWHQSENFSKFDDYISTVRQSFPGRDVIAGVYFKSSLAIPSVESVRYMIDHAIKKYDAGQISGLLFFSAIWLSRERSDEPRWKELQLPELLDRIYFPRLGEIAGRVVQARGRTQAAKTKITVIRSINGLGTLITKKFTDADGRFRFGALANDQRSDRAVYKLIVENEKGRQISRTIKVRAGKRTAIKDIVLKK
ncbi:MAG: carboxypeptidase-like regulatory domain-containing protein [Acidobacteriota bacterium]